MLIRQKKNPACHVTEKAEEYKVVCPVDFLHDIWLG